MKLYTRIITAWNDKTWKYPITAGAVAVPIVIVIQYISNGLYGIVPPFLAGLLVGLWAVETPIPSARVGWRAGLISGLSLVYGGMEFLLSTSDLWLNNSPALLTISAFVAVPLVTFLFMLIYGAVGAIGGMVGNWVYLNFDGATKLAFR